MATLSIASTAAADPVTVTTGNIFFSRQNMAAFQFTTADGSSFIGDLEQSRSDTFDPRYFCNACEGNTYNLSMHGSTTFPGAEGQDAVYGTVNRGGPLYTLTALSFDLLAGDIVPPGIGGSPRDLPSPAPPAARLRTDRR